MMPLPLMLAMVRPPGIDFLYESGFVVVVGRIDSEERDFEPVGASDIAFSVDAPTSSESAFTWSLERKSS